MKATCSCRYCSVPLFIPEERADCTHQCAACEAKEKALPPFDMTPRGQFFRAGDEDWKLSPDGGLSPEYLRRKGAL